MAIRVRFAETSPIGNNVKRICVALERLKRRRNILRTSDFEPGGFEVEPAGGCLDICQLNDRVVIADIGENGQTAKSRDHLAQKLYTLGGEISGLI